MGADLPIPAVDTSPGVNRRLAIITGSAILLVVLSCALVLRAFTGGVILPQIQLGGGFDLRPRDLDPALQRHGDRGGERRPESPASRHQRRATVL